MHQAAKLQMLQVALHDLVFKMEDAWRCQRLDLGLDISWCILMRRRNTPSSSPTLGIGIGAGVTQPANLTEAGLPTTLGIGKSCKTFRANSGNTREDVLPSHFGLHAITCIWFWTVKFVNLRMEFLQVAGGLQCLCEEIQIRTFFRTLSFNFFHIFHIVVLSYAGGSDLAELSGKVWSPRSWQRQMKLELSWFSFEAELVKLEAAARWQLCKRNSGNG